MAKKISKQPRIDSAVWLVLIVMKIYNEKEQGEKEADVGKSFSLRPA